MPSVFEVLTGLNVVPNLWATEPLRISHDPVDRARAAGQSLTTLVTVDLAAPTVSFGLVRAAEPSFSGLWLTSPPAAP